MFQFITHNNGRIDEAEGARLALEGGCRWIQLRMKEATDEEFIAVGKKISNMCRQAEATFILDDRVHLVKLLNADGVHLGKNDMPIADARRILGPDRIIGGTANDADTAIKAIADGADYLGIGPFRFTTTKQNLSPVLGIEGLTRLMCEIRDISNIPVVAIGGIMPEDIAEIMQTGVTGIAASGVILNSENPAETAEGILRELGTNWIKRE